MASSLCFNAPHHHLPVLEVVGALLGAAPEEPLTAADKPARAPNGCAGASHQHRRSNRSQSLMLLAAPEDALSGPLAIALAPALELAVLLLPALPAKTMCCSWPSSAAAACGCTRTSAPTSTSSRKGGSGRAMRGHLGWCSSWRLAAAGAVTEAGEDDNDAPTTEALLATADCEAIDPLSAIGPCAICVGTAAA